MCLVALRQRESEFVVFDCFKETLCYISSALLPYFLQQLTLTGHKEAVSALTFSTPFSSSPTLLCSASADSVLLWGLEQEDSEGIHNKQQQTTTNNNENNKQQRKQQSIQQDKQPQSSTKCSLILQSQSFLVPRPSTVQYTNGAGFLLCSLGLLMCPLGLPQNQ